MTRTSSSDGYVTLVVLLIAGLLAAIVSSVLAVSRPALGLVRVGGDEVAAEGLLQGGVATAAYLLVVAQKPAEKVRDLVLRQETGEVSISVADEAARVDLNSADPPLLEGLFRSVGGSSMSAAAFAARVADWRDQDSDVTPGGAEANEYSGAGLGYLPANLPFHSVEELRSLLGLSAGDFERLAPNVTVFSGRATIDPFSASQTVLQAIPGISRNDLRRVMQARKNGQEREVLIGSLTTVAQYLLDKPSGVYRVNVEARLTNGFSDAVEAVIASPQQGGGADYQVVSWSRLATAASK